MTNWNINHYFPEFAKLDRYMIGSDKMAAQISKAFEQMGNTAMTAYPPFNLKKTDDNVYVIEMAVAGFGRQDIEMTLEDNKLIIKGSVSHDSDEKAEAIYKGIAERPFNRSFVLNDNVEVKNAQLINGMLKVWLEHIIPDHKKPKKIDIVDTDAVASTKEKLPKE
jgi:molecular chaperone IbpA